MPNAASTSGIYRITNTATGHYYVGSSTRSIARRWAQHKCELRRGNHTNQRLQRAFAKYGEDAFEWVVLAVIDPGDVIATEERLLAQVFGRPDCYNMSPSALAGMHGRKHSDATRAKLSERRLTAEERSHLRSLNLGKRQTLATAEKKRATWAAKMASGFARRVTSAEARQKMSAAKIGHVQSGAVREKKRLALLGRKLSPENIAKRQETNRRKREASDGTD